MSYSPHTEDGVSTSRKPGNHCRCPVVSSSVHPRGWTANRRETHRDARIQRASRVSTPQTQLSRSVCARTPTPPAIVADRGWTVWTAASPPLHSAGRSAVTGKWVSTPGGGHYWTRLDTGGEHPW